MESPVPSSSPDRNAARALKTSRKLVRRYLDPGKTWDAARDAQLWALLRAHPGCADHYRQATATHRMLVGADPAVPSGFEQQRRMAVVVDAASGTKAPTQPRFAARWRLLGGALAAVLIAAVALPLLMSGPGPDDGGEWLQARGLGDAEIPARIVGLGVAGVTDDAVEYEVIATDAVYQEDYLRLSYTNEREDLGFVFVLGIQPERAAGEQVTWIAPIPDEGRSVAIDFGRWLQMPFEVHVGARHVEGPLIIVSIFTNRPLALDDVAHALDAADLSRVPSTLELSDILLDSRRLQLPSDTVIQTLRTTVYPGSQQQEETPR